MFILQALYNGVEVSLEDEEVKKHVRVKAVLTDADYNFSPYRFTY